MAQKDESATEKAPAKSTKKMTSTARAASKSVAVTGESVEAMRVEIVEKLGELPAETPVAATVGFAVKAGKESHFLRHLDDLAEATRRKPGLKVFSYHLRPGEDEDVKSYFVYEDWRSAGEYREHWESGDAVAFGRATAECFVEMPVLDLLYGSDDVGGAPVPKTGLSRCWNTAGDEVKCDGTGDDADIDAGVDWPEPRFTDNEDGTVTDHLTDLVWLLDADRFGEVTWEQALEKAKFLAAGGHGLTDGSKAGDWRLPNIRELRSLLDYSAVAPMIPEENPFENVQNAIYWTSTTLASAPTLAWMTTLGIGPAVFDLKFNSCRMWPVRGTGRVAKTGQFQCWDSQGQPIACGGTGQDGDLRAGVAPPVPRFVANGDGTVMDKLTGLVWLETANPFGWRTWQQALDDCNALCDGRHGLSDGSEAGDWRLPNVLEFESLIDYGRFAPSLPPDHPFRDVGPTSYWTSTTVSSAPTQAMFSILGVGPSIFENKEHPFLVWPVRDAR